MASKRQRNSLTDYSRAGTAPTEGAAVVQLKREIAGLPYEEQLKAIQPMRPPLVRDPGLQFLSISPVQFAGGTPDPSSITFSDKALQKKFKHAVDFGVSGSWNNANKKKFKDALVAHLAGSGTKAISGTYRGEDVTHFLDEGTSLNVIVKGTAFLSGWKLSSDQLNHVKTSGNLGGG